MVPKGIEPLTFSLLDWCSNQLSYGTYGNSYLDKNFYESFLKINYNKLGANGKWYYIKYDHYQSQHFFFSLYFVI